MILMNQRLSTISNWVMPDRGQLMLNDQPIESVYTINFENAGLSGWQILGDVTINSTDEQTNAPAVSLDRSVADTSTLVN